MTKKISKSMAPTAKKSEGDNDEEVIETLKSEEFRGLPKSGRWWKDPKKERHSAIIKVKPLKSTWKKKMEQKAIMKATKDLETEIREKRKAEKEAKKQARLEQEKRREENRKKSEVVQVIRDTRKLKRIKKKQLRMIEKRDTN